METIITISLDDPETRFSVYRVDCNACGAVDKGYANQVVNRANAHNRAMHNGQGRIVKPKEL